MKVLPELYPADLEAPASNAFTLPGGLIGFEDHRHAELLYEPGNLPFLWLRLNGTAAPLHFVVIEPGGIIPGYEPELFDEHALDLGLRDAAEAMILNIVTLRQARPLEATVNLVGPIVVNRRTRLARQVVISNYSRYSAHHPLVEKAQGVGSVPAR
ncbi:MAG: flagellar assembly protein FliW [Opitutae bacterium]|nr:flagellar assembly protein FliW [Opitutae bacterium]